MKRRVLVVDDEKDIQHVLCYVLDYEGYETRSAGSGEEALDICSRWLPDLVILDIGLPGLSGLAICPRLLELSIPVLVLSSHDQDDEVVAGLEVGAEDYVKKPCNYKEILLRVANIIKRTGKTDAQQILQVGDIFIDRARKQVTVKGQDVHLTPTEYGILCELACHPGEPLSVPMLLEKVWHTHDWINGDELIKVNIRRLRKKIEPDPRHPRYLLNRWGQGYLLSNT